MKAAVLLEEYRDLRAGGASRMAIAEAYQRYHRQACREGTPPDALRTYSPNEVERFWAHTVPGPDGHVFWTGGKEFTRNAGASPRQTLPARWVWLHYREPLPTTSSVTTTCGEENCVALPHLKTERREGLNSYAPDHRILGRLQVVAMALGRAPHRREWERRRERPAAKTITKRFGSWEKAIRAAGLRLKPQVPVNRATEEQAIAGLRALTERLGHPPTTVEYDREHAWIQANGHPNRHAVMRALGGSPWSLVLKKAGL